MCLRLLNGLCRASARHRTIGSPVSSTHSYTDVFPRLSLIVTLMLMGKSLRRVRPLLAMSIPLGSHKVDGISLSKEEMRLAKAFIDKLTIRECDVIDFHKAFNATQERSERRRTASVKTTTVKNDQ